jgi:hypothetical protein
MVVYQFDVDEELWNRWKDTVPRSKSLDERLRELIEADADGRVTESPAESGVTPSEPEPAPEPETADAADEDDQRGKHIDGETRLMLRDELYGSGEVLERRLDALEQLYGELKREGTMEREELIAMVDLDDVGYDDGDSMMSNMVAGKLAMLPGVSADTGGTYRYNPEATDE